MTLLDLAFRDFVDALETSHTEDNFKAAADRFALRLGYRWFAYLGFTKPVLKALSSYPIPWVREYIEQRYEDIDPVICLARSSRRSFQWDRRTFRLPSTSQQLFFTKAAKFGIHSGATVPIRGGFGRFAAFTMAGNMDPALEARPTEVMDILQLAGLYYHAHVYAKLPARLDADFRHAADPKRARMSVVGGRAARGCRKPRKSWA